VYFSDNQGQTWEQEAIGSSKTAHQLIAEPESELTVKITTQDAAGNESAGVIKTVIIPALTSTGPVALGLVGLSSISAYFYRSQKRRKTKSEKFLD
jgi:hypothetical protein